MGVRRNEGMLSSAKTLCNGPSPISIRANNQTSVPIFDESFFWVIMFLLPRSLDPLRFFCLQKRQKANPNRGEQLPQGEEELEKEDVRPIGDQKEEGLRGVDAKGKRGKKAKA